MGGGLTIKLRVCASVEKNMAKPGSNRRSNPASHSPAIAGIKAVPRNSKVNDRKSDSL